MKIEIALPATDDVVASANRVLKQHREVLEQYDVLDAAGIEPTPDAIASAIIQRYTPPYELEAHRALVFGMVRDRAAATLAQPDHIQQRIRDAVVPTDPAKAAEWLAWFNELLRPAAWRQRRQ